MHFQYSRAACLGMKAIHILGDQTEVFVQKSFQFHQGGMTCVGLRVNRLSVTDFIESPDQFGVSGKAFRGGYIFHPLILPQTTGIAKGAQARFCADACSSQNHQPGIFCNLNHVIATPAT